MSHQKSSLIYNKSIDKSIRFKYFQNFNKEKVKMELMRRMNKKLDIGWKMTNSSCQKCNGVTLADPKETSKYYCPKCDKNFQFQAQQNTIKQVDQKQEVNAQQDYYNQVLSESEIFKKPIQKQQPARMKEDDRQMETSYQKVQNKTNNVSKKLGQKLLQGWAMLQQCCQDCNVPLMQSKRGQRICFGCQKDYAKIQAEEASNKIENTKRINEERKQKTENKASQNINSQKKSTNIFQKNSTSRTNITNQTKSALIQRINVKALSFLQQKLDKAINQNDISAVQRILQVVKSIKQ